MGAAETLTLTDLFRGNLKEAEDEQIVRLLDGFVRERINGEMDRRLEDRVILHTDRSVTREIRHLVTKDDFYQQMGRLDGRIDRLEEKMDSRMDHLEEKMDSRMDHLDGRINHLDGRINHLEKEMVQMSVQINGRIDQMDVQINGRMDQMNGRMDQMDVQINGRMDQMNGRMGQIESEIVQTNKKIDHLEEKMNVRMDQMDGRMDEKLNHMNVKLSHMDGKLSHMSGLENKMQAMLYWMIGGIISILLAFIALMGPFRSNPKQEGSTDSKHRTEQTTESKNAGNLSVIP